MTAALTALAEPIAANNFGDTREGGLAGPMGLFIISLLAIGTVLLIRNMNKRLRRLPQSFPAPGEEIARGGDRADVMAGDTDLAETAVPDAPARRGAVATPDSGGTRAKPGRRDGSGV